MNLDCLQTELNARLNRLGKIAVSSTANIQGLPMPRKDTMWLIEAANSGVDFHINGLQAQSQNVIIDVNGCDSLDYVLGTPSAQVKTKANSGLIGQSPLNNLVMTEEAGDKWRLYMPDSIRQHIDKSAMRNLSVYPGIQEWNDTMEELNKLQMQVEEDVRLNPTILPIQQLPSYLQRLRDEVKSLDKLQKKLERLEPQIKQYNIDFTNVYSSIRESRNQCETKLALMGMFRWG